MLINFRNALMGGKRLPYDAEVEYLESTGTQYINTGIIGSSETKVEISAYSTNTTQIRALFGARNATGNRPSFAIWQTANSSLRKMRFDYNSATKDSVKESYENAWSTTTINTIVKNGQLNYVNGMAQPSNESREFTLPVSFCLCTINSSNAPVGYYFTGRIYSCKIWQNNVLVRDFIPVRKGTVGYLYDRVSGKLFGNAGTGDFVVGPDKS